MMLSGEDRGAYALTGGETWTAGSEYPCVGAATSWREPWVDTYRNTSGADEKGSSGYEEEDQNPSYSQPAHDASITDHELATRIDGSAYNLQSRRQPSRIPRPIARNRIIEERGIDRLRVLNRSRIPRFVGRRSVADGGISGGISLGGRRLGCGDTSSYGRYECQESESSVMTDTLHDIIPTSPIIQPPLMVSDIASLDFSSSTIDAALDNCIARTCALIDEARAALSSAVEFEFEEEEEVGDERKRAELCGQEWERESVMGKDEETLICRRRSSLHPRVVSTDEMTMVAEIPPTDNGQGSVGSQQRELYGSLSSTTTGDIIRVDGWYRVVDAVPARWREIGCAGMRESRREVLV